MGIMYKKDPDDDEAYEIWSSSGQEVSQETELANSENQDAEEIASAYDKASKRVRVGTKEKDKASETGIMTLTGCAIKNKYDSDSDEAILDSCFGKRKQSSKGATRTSSRSRTRSRSSRKTPRDSEVCPRRGSPRRVRLPGSCTAAAAGLRVPNVSPLPSSSTAKQMGVSQVTSLNDALEAFTLKLTQQTRLLSEDGSVMMLTTHNYKELTEKVENKFTPENKTVLASTGGRSSTIASELDSAFATWVLVGPLVESLHASEGVSASADYLKAQAESVRNKGVPLAPLITLMATVRASIEAVKQRKFADLWTELTADGGYFSETQDRSIRSCS